MEEFRHFLSLVLIYIMPIVIAFWVMIHAFSETWRKNRPVYAYLFAGISIACVVLIITRFENTLLGTDLGSSLPLFFIGAVIYILSWLLWRPVKHHLDFRTFAGIPEVTNEDIDLITDGPFAMVRHPRYLMVWIGVLGWSLMANYSGAYVMALASLVGLFVIVKLEERDLVKRFGKKYEAYRQRVPQLIPTLRGVQIFLKENFRGKPKT